MPNKTDDIAALRQLGDRELQIVDMELRRQKKSVAVSYLLLFFFGGFGIHNFYIGRKDTGIFQLVMAVAGGGCIWKGFWARILTSNEPDVAASMTVVLGMFFLGLAGLTLLVDLFTLPNQINKRELNLRSKLLRELSPVKEQVVIGNDKVAKEKQNEKAITNPIKGKKRALPEMPFALIIFFGVAFLSLLGFFLIKKSPSLITRPIARQNGYTLQPQEQKILSFMLEDSVSGFQRGGYSSFIGKDLRTVSAVEVEKAYEANQVAADEKYFRKRFRLKGVIESVNSGLGNEPYIILRGTNLFLGPQVYFQDANMERIVALRKGQKLDVVCNGAGAVIGMPMFKNCVFLDNYVEQELEQVKNKIADFLAGKSLAGKSSEISIDTLVISSMNVARTLPKTSTCFSDGSACLAELEKFNKEGQWRQDVMISTIKDLRASGIKMSGIYLKIANKIDEMDKNNASKAKE